MSLDTSGCQCTTFELLLDISVTAFGCQCTVTFKLLLYNDVAINEGFSLLKKF